MTSFRVKLTNSEYYNNIMTLYYCHGNNIYKVSATTSTPKPKRNSSAGHGVLVLNNLEAIALMEAKEKKKQDELEAKENRKREKIETEAAK